jgi:hypothetical protein
LPTYKVTAPDGRTVRLTGDSPPTEQELEEVFAALPAKAAALAAPAERSNMDVMASSVKGLGKSAYNAVAGLNKLFAGPDLQGGPIGVAPPTPEPLPVAPDEQTAYTVGNVAQFMAPGGPVKGAAGMLAQGGKSAAIAAAQGETPRGAAVAGAFGAAGPLTAKVGEMVAPGLRKLAQMQYERALAATTKTNKATSGRITPELLDRGVVGNLEGLAARGARESAPVGRALGEAYEGATKAGVEIRTRPIIDRLGKLKTKYLVKNKAGETFSANPGAVARIEAVEELVGKFGDTAPPDQLWRLRQQIDDIITSTGTGFADVKPGTAKWLQTNARTAIQKELNKANPDLVKMNAEFSLWKGLEDVAKATIDRKRGQSGIVELGIRTGLGSTAGVLLGEDDRTWGTVGGLLGAATKHPLWRTVSATQKAHLAHVMGSGNAETAASILSRVLAGLNASGPSAPASSPTPGARP